MLRLRGVWMRGGTSKCWLFDAEAVQAALDATGTEPGALLAAAFGAADPRQIDGVGGATSTTSKAALVGRSTQPGVDVDYRFAQVGIGTRAVEWGSNCGNCATAVGLYALQTGLVAPRGRTTTVRMRNTNTGSLLAATVPTPHGAVPESGTATVPGVRLGGVPVELVFDGPAGSTTGRLLPTGRAVDRLTAPGLGSAEVTLVDAGAPAALLDAATLGCGPAEPVDVLAARVPALARMRRAAALAMGLAREADPVSHAVPKTGLVGPSVAYRTTDGEEVAAAEYDVAVRMVSMHAPHPSIGLTSAVAVAAAAGVPGSVVARLVPETAGGVLRLGTPAGVVRVRAERDAGGRLTAVALARAARRIAEAELFVPLTEGGGRPYERRPALTLA
jgi:2-methylaconitate cis-trans-isomerase PrpF